MRCVIERNGGCDFATIADLVIDGRGGSERGTSVIRDNHFEAHQADHKFIRLSNVRASDILRNYMLFGGIRLESSTSSVKVARNRFVTAGVAASGEVSDSGSGNIVIGSGPEANLYVWDNIVLGP